MTGRYRHASEFQNGGYDFRTDSPRFSEENMPKNLEVRPSSVPYISTSRY